MNVMRIMSNICVGLVIAINMTALLLADQESNGSIVLVEEVAAETTKNETYNLYLRSTYQQAKGNSSKALETFKKMMIGNHSKHSYEAFLKVLFDSGRFHYIEQLVNQRKDIFDTLFKDNLEIKLIIAQTYAHTGQSKKAEKMFAELAEKYPNNTQVAYYTAIAYLKKNELEKGLAFINQCLANDALRSKHFLFLFLQSKIYLQLNKQELALAAITKSLKIYPKFDRGWLFKAILQEQMGNVQDAIDGYKTFLDLVGRDPAIEKQLIQLLFAEKKFSEAAGYLAKIKSDKPEYFFDLAVLEFKGNNYERALEYVNKVLKQDENFEKARILKIDILLSAKKIDELLSFIKETINQNPDDKNRLHALLLLRKTPIAQEKILNVLNELVKKYPKKIQFYGARADFYLKMNKTAQALKAYQKMLDVVENDGLKSRILFQIAYIYFTNKNVEKTEETLKKALMFKPVYPSVYNLLAYHYAKRNVNLNEALELVDKALLQNPACYYYLDTKGYILLKLGKKEESVTILQAAHRLSPQDKKILKHLQAAQKLP